MQQLKLLTMVSYFWILMPTTSVHVMTLLFQCLKLEAEALVRPTSLLDLFSPFYKVYPFPAFIY